MVLSHRIILAVVTGDIRGVEAALAAGDDVNDENGTLLKSVCSSENEDARTGMIRFLLENGADPHASFHHACGSINADQVRLFVEHGVNVEARDEDGFLPLVLATHNDDHSFEVCRALLRHGARPDAPVLPGMKSTVADLAIASAHPKHQPAADLLMAVQDAGSWHRYCVEPSVKLLALRHLSLAGRAVPPPNLARLFSTRTSASQTPSKRPRTVAAPPTDVFKLTLEFWGGNHS